MKANKALKRLTKIEALMSEVTEKYSVKEPHLRHVLQEAGTAITRAKEAVSLRASSKARVESSTEHSKRKRAKAQTATKSVPGKAAGRAPVRKLAGREKTATVPVPAIAKAAG